MVYDLPFDPLSGMCIYHPMVCMDVTIKNDEEEEEEKEDDSDTGGDGGKKDGSGGLAVCKWKIVLTSCPKCTYNY